MIGKGAQYLTAAGFGRYRITAASLGSNLMFRMPWSLSGAAWQAIMAAFGVDGPAVIAATNEYLNGIAASDKAKATALASYINEDPMMVCSLGLDVQGVTMPVRFLVGDGTAYILTNLVPTLNTYDIHIKYKSQKINGGAGFIFGCRDDNQTKKFFLVNNVGSGGKMVFYYSTNDSDSRTGYEFQANKIYDVEVNKQRILINGNSYPNSLVSGNAGLSSKPMCIYTIYNGSSIYTGEYTLDNGISILEERNGWFMFLPIIRKIGGVDKLGMIDVMSNTFYQNAAASGSFTIEYTLPDGTPWTPPTP